MKKFLSAVCLCVAVAASVVTVAGQSGTRGNAAGKAAGANDGQQVVKERDEFSGATIVKLKPQKLVDTSEHQLTMSAEVKLEGKTYADGTGVNETVILEFVSRSKERVDFGDEELHFLVDGKQIKSGSLVGGIYNPNLRGNGTASAFKGGTRYTGGVSLSQMQQIANGKNVAMRFGSMKLTPDERLLSNLRDFVRAINSK